MMCLIRQQQQLHKANDAWFFRHFRMILDPNHKNPPLYTKFSIAYNSKCLYTVLYILVYISVSIGILVLWWQGVVAILSERQQFPLYTVFATCFRCSTNVALSAPLDPLCSKSVMTDRESGRERESKWMSERERNKLESLIHLIGE